eukprot:s1750_g3.t1
MTLFEPLPTPTGCGITRWLKILKNKNHKAIPDEETANGIHGTLNHLANLDRHVRKSDEIETTGTLNLGVAYGQLRAGNWLRAFGARV